MKGKQLIETRLPRRIGKGKAPRLTPDATLRAALARAYRYSFAKNTACWVLQRGRKYLAHPLPHPPGSWTIVAMVVAT